MSHHQLFTFCLLTGVILFGRFTAEACMCGERRTVAASYEAAHAVVLGRVVTVAAGSPEDKSPARREKARLAAKFKVEKAFKGDFKPGDVLPFGAAVGPDCVSIFPEQFVGELFLFYLDPPMKGAPFVRHLPLNADSPPMFYPDICRRAGTLDRNNHDDLLYLEKLAQTRGRTRISGTLTASSPNAPSFADVEIKITGPNKTSLVKTDRRGVFEIYDLPAGRYTVEAQIPFGWKISQDFTKFYPVSAFDWHRFAEKKVEFALEDKEHIGLDFSFVIDNLIRGRVLTPDGKPLPKACLQARLVLDPTGTGRSTCADENGVYEFTQMQPGNYLLVVNADGRLDGTHPFGAVYFPGVTDRARAAVVGIEPGRFLREIDIQIPHTAETVEISGRLLYADGTPAARGDVIFQPENPQIYDEVRVSAGSDGRFHFRLPKDAKGRLTGKAVFYAVDAKNCPSIREMLGAEAIVRLKTAPLEIGGGAPPPNLMLTLPIESCEPSK